MLCNCYPPSGAKGEAWNCPTHSSITSPMTTRHEQAMARIEEEIEILEKGVIIQELLAPIGYTPEQLATMPRLKSIREYKKRLSFLYPLKAVLELHESKYQAVEIDSEDYWWCESCNETSKLYFDCPTAEKIIEGVLG